MKSGARDKAEGVLHEIKGKLKEVTGKLIHNPKMEDEGTEEHAAGKLQSKVGTVKKDLDE